MTDSSMLCATCSPTVESKSATAKKRFKKTLAMYATMVTVSTFAIFFLEHVTLYNAVRTALVAAVAKTFAANWVTGLFQ